MTYLLPFLQLKKHVKVVSSKGQLKVDINYDDFLVLIKELIQSIDVDDTWYCSMYPDVAEAISSGTYRNAKHHFVENGYAEGRHPYFMKVDEAWYLKQYPDVGERIEAGDFASAQDHFSKHGYDEGRRPCPS